MEEIYKFLMAHKNEDLRVAFDIPNVWPDGKEIICRVMYGKKWLERDFILTPAEFPYISVILDKAYEEIMNNTYVGDLRRFSVSKEGPT